MTTKNDEDLCRVRRAETRAQQLAEFIEFVSDEDEDPEFRDPALFLAGMAGGSGTMKPAITELIDLAEHDPKFWAQILGIYKAKDNLIKEVAWIINAEAGIIDPEIEELMWTHR